MRQAFPSILVGALMCSSCFFGNALRAPFIAPHDAPQALPKELVRSDARIAVAWIGHATALVQLDDKVLLFDPVFTETVGLLSRRTVNVPMDPHDLPALDAVLVSHMHFDHFSLGSIEMIQDKIRRFWVPEGGLVYLTDFPFDAVDVAQWETKDDSGLEITAVPVKHNGMRYGADIGWMHAYTGWVVRYHGLAIYFGGDTAYDGPHFKETGARFPNIDVALLPIGPIHPRNLMGAMHMEPWEAIDAMNDLGAKRMVPVHYDTFFNSLDGKKEPLDSLLRAMRMKELDESRIVVMEIGEERVIVPR
jgi:L-ascorbate metabolism protein UlaG (beta-lactamase superfamily)